MYFLLFLLMAMMIMLVVIATTNENRLINVVMMFLSILVLFKGVLFMNKMNKGLIIFCFIIIIAEIIFCCIIYNFNSHNILSTDCEYYYLNNEKLSDVYFISNVNDKISSSTKNIIILNDTKLETDMFYNKNTNNIEKIIFLSAKPTIDSDLYEKIKNKIVIIPNHNKCLLIEKANNKTE